LSPAGHFGRKSGKDNIIIHSPQQVFATFLQLPTASEIRRIYVVRCF